MANVREIGERLPGIAALRMAQNAPAGPAPEVDPIAEAMRDRREMLAHKIRESGMSEAESEAAAAAAEADTRRMTAQMELETARAKLAEMQPRAGGGQMDVLMAMIEMFKSDRDTARSEVGELRQALMATIQESNARVIAALQDANRAPAQEPMASSLVAQITELKDIRGALLELVPTPDVAAAGRSIEEALALHRAREDHEYRMAELGHQRAMAERKMALDESKMRADSQARESAARSFEQVAPTIVKAFAQRIMGVNVEDAPALPQGGAPSATATCPNCQATMSFPEGSTETICQQCGQRWDLRQEGAPPPEPPTEGEPPPDVNGNGHGPLEPPGLMF